MRIDNSYSVLHNYYYNRPVFKSAIINPATIGAALTAGTALLGCAKILVDRSRKMPNETEKYINVREEFSKKLEPLRTDANKADWDFYINSTEENMAKSQEASEKLDEIFHDRETYEKLLAIDVTKLPKHEAKQLKNILRSFEEELNTGELKKALRDKENEIAQKYNSYIPKIDEKEVTKTELMKITETEQDLKIRQKAYDAKIKGGDLIAKDLQELVKLRNEYAKTKGYDNYFEYQLKEIYDVEPEFLDKLIDEVYSNAKDKISKQFETKEEELKTVFNVKELENYHYGLLLDSDPEKFVNQILENYSVEDIAKKAYLGMGYDIDKLTAEGKLTLDLYPRKNKNTHGFCFDIEIPKDTRILANLSNNANSLDTLCHELGHSVYNLGISSGLPYYDRDAASSAVTEAIAMMMGDLMQRENLLSGMVDEDLLNKFKEEKKEDEAYFVARSLEIIEFERDMYKNPEQDLAKLWQEKRDKYFNRKTQPDNEWATIPHYLSHPGYYQNYFRAALMKAQIYNHLKEKLGNITENSDTARYLERNIFKLGASIDEYDLIKQLTGKDFSSEDFIKSLD